MLFRKKQDNLFLSESSRQHIGRRALYFNNKVVLIAVIVFFAASGAIALQIINKRKGSDAASVPWVFSSSSVASPYSGTYGWNFATSHPMDMSPSNNVGTNLRSVFKPGVGYLDGSHGCWRYPVPGGVRVHTVKFRVVSNAAGANRVAIGVQNSSGYIEPYVYDRALNGSEPIDIGGLDVPPGGIIQICNRVTDRDGGSYGPGVRTFAEEKSVYVRDFAFFGNQTLAYAYSVVDYKNPPTTMVVGQTAEVIWRVKNEGSATWFGEGSANPTRLGTWNPQDRGSAFYSASTPGSNWLFNGRVRMQESQVAPGQIATFKYIVTARSQGNYTEHFNIVTDGITWHPSQPLFFTVNVPASSYSYSVVSTQKPPTVMAPGEVAPVKFTVKNTGNSIWYGEGIANPVRLGAWLNASTARNSAFATSGWLNANRIAMPQSGIGPGQQVTFSFNIKAPNTPGQTYTENFNLVRESVAWMPYAGLTFTTRIGSPCTNNAPNSLSVEAENASCGPSASPGPGEVQADSAASGAKRVLLYVPTQYVEDTIKPSLAGIYRAGAVLRLEGQGVVQHTLTKFTPGASSVSTSESRAPSTGGYNFSFMTQSAHYQKLTTDEINKGVSFRVRTTFLRPSGVTSGDTGNMFVDRIYLEKTGDIPAPVEYCANNAGTVSAAVEAERALCGPDTTKPVVEYDDVASGDKRVLLFATNQYAEYVFRPTSSGVYRAGGIVRSQDYNGSAVARISLTKLTPGAASVTTNEDRVAPSGAYDRRFMTQVGNYQNLTQAEIGAGVSFRVRITFTNNDQGTGGDRNLFVDTLYTEKVAELPPPVEFCANNAGTVSAAVEAERALCGPDANKPVVQADGAASAGKRVLLFATSQYAEYVFKPTSTGIYRAGSIVQSQDYSGTSAVARLSLTKLTPGAASVTTNEDRVAPSGAYDRRFMTQSAQYQRLTAAEISQGVSFRVRVTFMNNDQGSTGDRNLFVDTLYVEKFGELVEFCANNAGTVSAAVEAERALCGPDANKPVVQADGAASAGKRVLLFATSQYAEYVFKPSEAGSYRGTSVVQSQDYNGSAVARISLTKLTPGAASVTTNEDRVAPSGAYDRRFMTQVGNYQNLTQAEIGAGVSFRVRITFTNNDQGTGGDRNLLVDSIGLERLQTTELPTTCTTAIAKPTNVIGRTQAQDAPVRSAFTATTAQVISGANLASVRNADLCNAVVALSNSVYVQTTFTAPANGKYAFIVRARSDVAKDVNYTDGLARARINITYSQPAVTGETSQTIAAQAFPAFYEASTVGKVHELKSGTRVTIRATYTNDYRSSSADRNLWLDYIEMRSTLDNTPSPVPPSTPDLPIDDVPADVESMGGVIIQAEEARKRNTFGVEVSGLNKASIGEDSVASGGQSVRLYGGGSSVEHRFIVPRTGLYDIGATLRSVDALVSTASNPCSNQDTSNRRACVDIYVDGDLKINNRPLPSAFSYIAATGFNFNAGSAHTIRVVFINDLYQPPADRDAIIDRLILRPRSVSSTPFKDELPEERNWNAWSHRVTGNTAGRAVLSSRNNQIATTLPKLSGTATYNSTFMSCWSRTIPTGYRATGMSYSIESSNRAANEVLIKAAGKEFLIAPARASESPPTGEYISYAGSLQISVLPGQQVQFCTRLITSTNFNPSLTNRLISYRLTGTKVDLPVIPPSGIDALCIAPNMIEAENAATVNTQNNQISGVLGGTPAVSRAATGGRAVVLQRAGSVEHRFNVTKAGNYSIGATMLNNLRGTQLNVDVFIDGVKILANRSVTNTNFQFIGSPQYNLSTGIHTVRIAYTAGYASTDNNLWVDRLILQPSN